MSFSLRLVYIPNTTMNDNSPNQRTFVANSNAWMKSKPARSELRLKLEEFLANSTIHGLNQLSLSKSLIRRATWLSVFLFCMSFLYYGIVVDLNKYLKYDIVMSSRIQRSSYLPFPAVTLCSLGLVKKSRLNGHDMNDLMDYMESIYNGEEPKV